MTEWIWLNGEIMPLAEARVGVEDRGFQFADGVYEVIRIYNGRLFTLKEHLDRLERSAREISIGVPLAQAALTREIERLLQKAPMKDGMIYLQLTRGESCRNHVFPECRPTLLFYARQLPPVPAPGTAPGTKLHSVADERWKRCWIKSIALLPNVLAKNAAIAAGADEAVFVDGGVVTECAASNLFAIFGKQLVTHPVGPKVLPGITRMVLMDLAKEVDLQPVQRPMSEAEAMQADEVFITSTTREMSWVSEWNGRGVAPGRCGPATLRLHQAYQQRVARDAGRRTHATGTPAVRK